ncbi:hypothetical protein C8R46DRAFT_475082 [Mycena filopes]|nr:hypothetical protein C8R46DRAFT_475082 [Mycena filopes]
MDRPLYFTRPCPFLRLVATVVAAHRSGHAPSLFTQLTIARAGVPAQSLIVQPRFLSVAGLVLNCWRPAQARTHPPAIFLLFFVHPWNISVLRITFFILRSPLDTGLLRTRSSNKPLARPFAAFYSDLGKTANDPRPDTHLLASCVQRRLRRCRLLRLIFYVPPHTR